MHLYHREGSRRGISGAVFQQLRLPLPSGHIAAARRQPRRDARRGRTRLLELDPRPPSEKARICVDDREQPSPARVRPGVYSPRSVVGLCRAALREADHRVIGVRIRDA